MIIPLTQIYAPSTATRKTWIWAIPIIVLVFTFGGQIIALLPAKSLNLITRENIETYPRILYLIIGSFTVVACIFALWIRYFEKGNFASVGFTLGSHAMKYSVTGILLAVLMSCSTVAVVALLGGYVEEHQASFNPGDLIPVLVLLFAFILQSSTEEFVFRGWMMARLAERYGVGVGVVGNSALFALMHFDAEAFESVTVLYTVMLAAFAFLFAVFLSLLALKQRSIWGACAWHAIWNWSFITWFGLPTTGLDLGLEPLLVDLMSVQDASMWLTGGDYGPEGSVISLVVLIIASLWLAVRISQNNENTVKVNVAQ